MSDLQSSSTGAQNGSKLQRARPRGAKRHFRFPRARGAASPRYHGNEMSSACTVGGNMSANLLHQMHLYLHVH